MNLEYQENIKIQESEEKEDLLNEAMYIAGLFELSLEDVERMKEINERLRELGL